MADISEYIEQIQNAVYGEEVRGSIINSLEAINYEVNKEAYAVTLTAEGWTEDSEGYLVQTVENEHVTDHSTILVAMQTSPTGLNLDAAANYSNIYHATVHDGYIKFYILETASADVPINYVLISSNSGKVFITGSGITGSGGQLVLRGINIINMPNKVQYRKGETILTTGLLVKARYNNGSVADVTAQCTFSTTTAQSTIGMQTITVSYTEDDKTATTSFQIVVYELSNIRVTVQPTNRTYHAGDAISTTGMTVVATYTDAHTTDVTQACIISPQSAPATAGESSVTVTYTEDSITKNDNFSIEVYELDANITVSSSPEVRITATGTTTGKKYTGTTNAAGICVLTVHYSDTYSIVGSDDEATSSAASVQVVSGTYEYTVTITMPFSWTRVKKDVNNGNLAGYTVGDTFEVAVQGDDTYEFVLVAKNHDANNQLIFGLKADGLNARRTVHTPTEFSNDPNMSAGDTDIYTWLNESFFYQLPSSLQNVISSRSMQVSKGFEGNGILETITKKIWLPRAYEFAGSGGPAAEQNAYRINQFEYYQSAPEYMPTGTPDGMIASSIFTRYITRSSETIYVLYLYYVLKDANTGTLKVSMSAVPSSGVRIMPHFQIVADAT